MLNLPKIIQGNGLSLVKAEATMENARDLFRLVMRNREELAPYFKYLVSEVTNKERAFDYLSLPMRLKMKDFRCYFIQKDNNIIGEMAAKLHQGAVVIGYWIDKKYQRQGITSQSLSLLEKAVFDAGYISVSLNISPRNQASLNLALKAGYRECSTIFKEQTTRYFEKTKLMYLSEQNNCARKICVHDDMYPVYQKNCNSK